MIDVVMILRHNAPRRLPGSRLWVAVAVCVFLLPEALEATNHARWTTNYYNVTGSTIHEIRRSMLRNRPSKVTRDALTEWDIRTRFGTGRLQGGYRCSGFTTTTTIRMTLPRWTPPEAVSDSVKQEWERYLAVLSQHEAGHGQIAMATAGELHRRVAGVGIHPDPDGLKSTVKTLVVQTLQEFRERDREYDRLTRHGLEQGATLGSRDGLADSGSFSGGARRTRERGHRGRRSEQ